MSLTLVPPTADLDLLHTALQVSLSDLCETGQWDYGEVWIPATAESFLELHPAHINASKNSADAIALEQFWACTKGLIFPPNVGLPGRVWLSRQPEWLPDAADPSEREFLRHYMAKALGVKTGLGIPILVDRRVVAVFVFFMTRIRESDPQLMESMTTAAAQIGWQLEEILRSQPSASSASTQT